MPQPLPVIVGGTIAVDHVKTPSAEADELLGGSAAYAALAASYFTSPVHLVGIVGHDYPEHHLAMLARHGVTLDGVERSPDSSFRWSGEYLDNMNRRVTRSVALNVLENWQVKVPAHLTDTALVVLANMSPDNQLALLAQCTAPRRFVVADTMDLWIEIANERLHEVLRHLDLFVINESEARDFTGAANLVLAGERLLAKGPRHVVIKLGEFGAILFSQDPGHPAADRLTSDKPGLTPAHPATGGTPLPRSGEATPALAATAGENALPRTGESPSPLLGGASTPQNAPGCPEIFRCAAFPLRAVIDPTGAGDTFLGALAGSLATVGHISFTFNDLRDAVVRGSVLASFTCEAFSTRRLEDLPAAEIQARLEAFRKISTW